jgi:hypothetical protein
MPCSDVLFAFVFFLYFPYVVISLVADKIDLTPTTAQVNARQWTLLSSHIVTILIGATVTLALPRG